MYELFAKAQSLDEPVLIRIVQNRMTVENRRIPDELRKKRSPGRVEVRLLRDGRSGIPEREAVLQMRYAPYSIKRPHILNPVKTVPDGIAMQGIYVKEEKPPKGKEAVEWLRKLRFRGGKRTGKYR
ncbi:MAG: hypothetical protein LBE10_01855 [Treponema sp.]|jgi:hypothetical protein|nr:hypothetical protein [Treponema sp.]